MKKISDLLERFTVIAQNGEITRNAVSDALKQIGLNVESKNINIYSESVKIKISPAQRSELFLKQAKLIEILSKNPLTAKIKRVY